MSLQNSPHQKHLDFWKKQSLKAREEEKELKKVASKAAQTSEYIKSIENMYIENDKLKEGQ